MAKQICETPLKVGVGVLVENQNPLFGASEKYVNFYLTPPKSNRGRCYTFTEKEVGLLFSRPDILTGWEPDRGELYRGFIGGHGCWVARLEWKGVTKLVRISLGFLSRGLDRANKNPEDVTKPTWLARMFG